MANFNNLTLTTKGIRALMDAQTGTTLTLSKIGLGSGQPASGASVSELVKPELMLPISETKKDNNTGLLTIVAKMTNEDIEEGFYWRETGLFFEDADGSDVLFAYANVDNQYDYVPAYSDHRYVKHIRIANIVTDSADIVVNEQQGLLYVDVLTFAEHTDNRENPHGVTHEQLGGTAPANTVFAGPNNSEGKPSFRKLVADDFPKNYNAPTASAIKTTSLGNMEGKTIPDLQNMLKEWATNNIGKPNACATFACNTTNFYSLWNARNTSTDLGNGYTWFVRLVAVGSAEHFTLEISTYLSRNVFYVTMNDGTWGYMLKLAIDEDKAPSGYGLGKSIPETMLQDCNDGIYSGWYTTHYQTLNSPKAVGGWLRADMFSDLYGTQTWFCELEGGMSFQRYKNNGIWGEWKDVRPSAFAPSGYGLGGLSKWLTGANLDDITTNGWYSWSDDTANAPFPYGSMLVINRGEGTGASYVYQIAFNDGVYDETIIVRKRTGGKWGEWVNWSPSAFAPSGYGLGGLAVRTNDWNTTYDNGFYFGITNSPDGGWWYGYVVRDGADTNRITQTIFYGGIICTRTGTIGSLPPWEYVNPPMQLGVEYRTTEICEGKPVYTKLIDFGYLPNVSIKSITDDFTYTKIVDIQGMVYGQGANNGISTIRGISDVWVDTVEGVVRVNVLSSEDLSQKTMWLTLKYTKE